MILQALYQYYHRKSANADSKLAPFGFEEKELPFIVEMAGDGRLIQIEDTRSQDGSKKVGRTYLVPHAVKKTSGIAANLLWDNAEYVLGIPRKQKPRKKAPDPERVANQHRAFRERVRLLPEPAAGDPGIRAILAFLEHVDLEGLQCSPLWDDLQTNPNIGLRLHGDSSLVCQRIEVVKGIQKALEEDARVNERGICLITGEEDSISRLHPPIKGVWGAKTSGANIVSFNLDASSSWNKKQGANAPVGEQAAFAYTTALNNLLQRDSPQRLQVGDSSTIFWAASPTELETRVVDIFGETRGDDPDRDTDKVDELYRSVHHGRYIGDDAETVFYVLGLAPNSARIAVRFWEVTTVGRLAERIVRHFDDLQIDHGSRQPEHLSLFRLLVAVATQSKADNIPPNLAGETLRSILAGTPYPQSLLAGCLRRIRAEQSKKDNVTYERAALVKACLNRKARYFNPDTKEEITVSLDRTNANPGYRLGRLFATLEKIQEEANPGINATIRDRFYGAASATPVSVFPNLVKLSKHHLSKLENRGRETNFEKLLGEIFDALDDFPSHLTLDDQGRFAIGYYHQRRDLFTKHETGESTDQGAAA